MAEMKQNENEQQQQQRAPAQEEEEKKQMVNDKEKENDGASDDSERTESSEPPIAIKPPFNKETGEIKIHCAETCPEPLVYTDKLLKSKEAVYGEKRMPRNIKCYYCKEKMSGFQQGFYCGSGERYHAPRYFCASCVLCQVQVHLKKKNETLGDNEKLSGDTMIENVGKLATFTLFE